MSLKGLTSLIISKEKRTSIYTMRVNIKIEQKKFRAFINNNLDEFIWHENTTSGKYEIENIDKFPDRESVKKRLSQYIAYAFYKKEKGYYGMQVLWSSEYEYIFVSFNNSRVTIPALEILLAMADYCDAMLLVNGRKQITKEFIEKEKLEIAEKKTVKKTNISE